jgi:Flp pilus assembly protein TadG
MRRLMVPAGLAQATTRSPRAGVAALEFAIVAPVVMMLIWGVYDISRALLAWEETVHAAEAVAQAAEKLSITNTQDPLTGKPITSLTSTQMQLAMTSIYAEMPWLDLGNNTGTFSGSYSVTLSSIAFTPTCNGNQYRANSALCNTQVPVVLWSSYLTEGGSQLMSPPPGINSLWRLCAPTPIVKPQFPNDVTQRLVMIDPNLVPNPTMANMNLIPQVVADVEYSFVPTFPFFAGRSYTFYASATFPAPLGDEDQEIVYDQKDSPANVAVESCPGGNAITQ